MLDFETAWEQQKDLGALVAPRTPRVKEIYWPNSNYGFSRALKQYAGLPVTKPIFGVLPHGVYLAADRELFPGERDAPLPVAFTYPEYVDEIWREQSDKTVIPSASPFLYALALMKSVLEPVERSGTAFFPSHSTAKVRIETQTDRIIELLDGLPEEYKPVTVCMHWYDYTIGLHEPYEERGFKIVSAGNLHDDNFLFRLVHIMRAHKYACSNSLGSNTFYAIATGIPYFLLDVRTTVKGEPGFFMLSPSTQREAENERVRQMFLGLPDGITQEQQAAVDYYLGWDRMKTQSGLREELLKAEYLRQQGVPRMQRS